MDFWLAAIIPFPLKMLAAYAGVTPPEAVRIERMNQRRGVVVFRRRSAYGRARRVRTLVKHTICRWLGLGALALSLIIGPISAAAAADTDAPAPTPTLIGKGGGGGSGSGAAIH